VSFAHFPLVPLVIDIKKSELSSNNIANQVLGEEHKFSRSIAADNVGKKRVNLSLFDVLTVCFDLESMCIC
jgi:hypothetical protein